MRAQRLMDICSIWYNGDECIMTEWCCVLIPTSSPFLSFPFFSTPVNLYPILHHPFIEVIFISLINPRRKAVRECEAFLRLE